MAMIYMLATSLSVVMLVGTSGAAQQKVSAPVKTDKTALATENVKELLLLMDTDKNGKVTKQEWMKFMEAEFDRLDIDKSGQLDPKELAQSRVVIRPIRSYGK
jgi:Ca2+-binding EF-hand superfamily protein